MERKRIFRGTVGSMVCTTLILWLSGCTTDDSITSDPNFIVDFEFSLSHDLAPAELTVINKTAGGTSFNWTFTGATSTTSTDENPAPVNYEMPGTYTILLEASNGSETKSASMDFKLYETDEIVIYEGLKLGSTHLESTVGVSFSSSSGKVIKSGDYTSSNGSSIDILYYGSETHSLFTILSPTFAGTDVLTPIPNAKETIFIYTTDPSSENYFTAAEFDAMTDDRPIRDLPIVDKEGSLTEGVTGETTLPRVFVFRNSKNKRGIIKVTELNKGVDGNIVFDLKVQK